jgi:hypothetical protein
LAPQVGWIAAASVVVSILGAVLLGRRRRSLGLVPSRWPWAVLAVYTVALLATYVISPYDIQWHLVTSIDRVGVLIVLVALATAASWVLVAVAPEPDRRDGVSGGDRSAVQPRRTPVDAAP